MEISIREKPNIKHLTPVYQYRVRRKILIGYRMPRPKDSLGHIPKKGIIIKETDKNKAYQHYLVQRESSFIWAIPFKPSRSKKYRIWNIINPPPIEYKYYGGFKCPREAQRFIKNLLQEQIKNKKIKETVFGLQQFYKGRWIEYYDAYGRNIIEIIGKEPIY